MGKVKAVVMGDEVAEEAARKKAVEKRAAKKQLRHSGEPEATPESVVEEPKKQKRDSGQARMTKDIRGKKYIKVVSLVDKKKKYSLSEALDLVKKTSYSSFDGSVEAIFNVLEKGIRGTVSLPHGTGKTIRIRIADDALIANPVIDFDILVAHPSMMPKLAKIAKILGPKGLMPNPKTGTIGEKPEELVEKLSKGQVNWKTENDFPIIHSVIGKVSFDEKKLAENFGALVKSISKEKIVSIFLKPTMGPSIQVQI